MKHIIFTLNNTGILVIVIYILTRNINFMFIALTFIITLNKCFILLGVMVLYHNILI